MSDSGKHPADQLESIAKQNGLDITDVRFAQHMDENDPLKHLREQFTYPTMKSVGADLTLVKPEEESLYFAGNSLGLCPKNVRKYANEEVDKWEQTALRGHTNGSMPWAWCDELLEEDMAKIVGANREEVALMNALTINLHLLLVSFYRPTPQRYKVMLEAKAFPSDHYAFESHCKLHGYKPEDVMVCIEPREGESTLRTEDILARIEKEGDEIAVICFAGLQYYTGQFFDMATITKAGQAKGAYVGWDLAHAVANVPLSLHDWNVDFACWCTYKYLNSGAGGVGGLFINERHRSNDFPRLMGWWSHNLSTRFVMDNKMELSDGARGYRVSNPSAFQCLPLKGSFDVFKMTNMAEIRKKSLLLTGYLEALIKHYFQKPKNADEATDNDVVYVDILTPADPNRRGAQLSLSFNRDVKTVHAELEKRGVTCDVRLPSVIRVAPAPLYCGFTDVHRFISTLKESLAAAAKA